MAELAEKIYGDALFQSALEENKLDEVKAQLDTLVAVFQKETAFLSMLDSPAMDAGDKQKILQETFDGKVEEILYNFLRILWRQAADGAVFAHRRLVCSALPAAFGSAGSGGRYGGIFV